MIRHVVCFRLKDENQIAQWQQVSALLSQIEGVKNFRALPLLKRDRFHCALYMEFDDEKALQYYQVHPLHQHYVNEAVPPLAAEKMVVDLMEGP